jgi:hypothetical protein
MHQYNSFIYRHDNGRSIYFCLYILKNIQRMLFKCFNITNPAINHRSQSAQGKHNSYIITPLSFILYVKEFIYILKSVQFLILNVNQIKISNFYTRTCLYEHDRASLKKFFHVTPKLTTPSII